MGWNCNTYKQTKKQFTDEIKSQVGNALLNYKVVDKEMWCLVKESDDDFPVIIVYLLDSNKGCWQSKKISESEGPYYYNCPNSILDKAPVQNKDWRERCKLVADLKCQIKKLQLNDLVYIYKEWCGEYIYARRNNLIVRKSGKLYRVQKQQVEKIIKIK